MNVARETRKIRKIRKGNGSCFVFLIRALSALIRGKKPFGLYVYRKHVASVAYVVQTRCSPQNIVPRRRRCKKDAFGPVGELAWYENRRFTRACQASLVDPNDPSL